MTSEELFEVPEQLSPKLQWIRDHEITVTPPWRRGDVFTASTYDEDGLVEVLGETEDEALVKLAVKLDIRLWNEEGFKT